MGLELNIRSISRHNISEFEHQKGFVPIAEMVEVCILVSIVESIPACHAGDRGSIPRLGETLPFYTDKSTTSTKMHIEGWKKLDM